MACTYLPMSSKNLLGLGLILLLLIDVTTAFDYGLALSKSILYYEAQRSGKLPADQRVTWRGDSAIYDGITTGNDLVGGYYDAGDNVKFGLPMAYTITMLAWSVVDYAEQLTTENELANALSAVKWGTDYLIKAHPEPNVLWGQVGDGDDDHKCWQRPEDMTTSRKPYKIDAEHPGADLAGETSAAFAAASMAFNITDPTYSATLLTHARQLFDFGVNNEGVYQSSIPLADKYYHSSGFQDELLWAAAWLHRATGEKRYLDYLGDAEGSGDVRTMFSWDDKFIGVQALVGKIVMEGLVPPDDIWIDYKSNVENWICNLLGKGDNNIQKTPAGMLWWQDWNNLQYTTSAAFIASTYAKYLRVTKQDFPCPDSTVKADELVALAKSQVDYILGANPKSMSYMVGFGTNYPKKIHHRAASIVSIKKDITSVTCQGGFTDWYNKDQPDPNVLEGAVVGGPNVSDEYDDSRSNYQHAEPATATVAPLVGVLARFAWSTKSSTSVVSDYRST